MESPNEREQRHALLAASKSLGRIADALEGLLAIAKADEALLADDDGPDPVEAAMDTLFHGTIHGFCSSLSRSLCPDTGRVWCGDHDAMQLVGTIDMDTAGAGLQDLRRG